MYDNIIQERLIQIRSWLPKDREFDVYNFYNAAGDALFYLRDMEGKTKNPIFIDQIAELKAISLEIITKFNQQKVLTPECIKQLISEMNEAIKNY